MAAYFEVDDESGGGAGINHFADNSGDGVLAIAGVDRVRDADLLWSHAEDAVVPQHLLAACPLSRFDVPTKPATNGVAGRSYTSAGVPTCSIRPALKTAMRSDIVSASSWSCVTKTKVIPTCRCNS